MFSKSCEYAIRAMIFIANRSAMGMRSGIAEIAKGTNSPQPFIAKILQALNGKGLVSSAKGPNGGYYISDVTHQCTIADIVSAIDGERLFKGCGLGLPYCSDKRPCPLHDEIKAFRKSLFDTLQSYSVHGFNEELLNGTAYLKR